ncbi:OmpA family protein [Flavobacteriales bacterium]|nr:OmpA family protein [Flavobacteriales bacterium]
MKKNKKYTLILIQLFGLVFLIQNCNIETKSSSERQRAEILLESEELRNATVNHQPQNGIDEIKETSVPSLNWSNPVMNPFGANLGEYVKALFITHQFDKIIKFVYYPDCYDEETIKYFLLNSDFGYDIKLTNRTWKNDSVFDLSYKATKNNTSSLDVFRGVVINDTAKLFFYPNNSNPFKLQKINEFNELCDLKNSLDAVQFEFNSANISKGSVDALQGILNYFKSNRNRKALLTGHTSSEGSSSFNMSLSISRTKAIYDYLRANGISKEQIQYSGKGDKEPIFANDTEENKKKNRRVEVFFLD